MIFCSYIEVPKPQITHHLLTFAYHISVRYSVISTKAYVRFRKFELIRYLSVLYILPIHTTDKKDSRENSNGFISQHLPKKT